MTGASDRRPPNLLVVVMDCVRASDFPGGSEPVEGMTFTEELLRESTVFQKAVSVAPWTIPAHASLFTGMNPWEHGCHAQASLTLREDIPRLAALLSNSGYATMSLSANPFISSAFGLVAGFERAVWGGWWESYARLPREIPPDGLNVRPGGSGALLRRLRRSPLGAAMLQRMDDVYRYPLLLDSANRVLQHLRAPGHVGDVMVSPWIEPTFARWIRETPVNKPIFAFVNLVDAHEPYYADPSVIRSTRDWVSYARSRQDHVAYAAGSWSLDSDRARQLHQLYRASIRRIDRRLQTLASLLEAEGRWDSTTVVLTSDHGQAFGEHGVLFHMFRPDEPELRIPLIYRGSKSRRGRLARGWASLIDVAPTLLGEASVHPPTTMSGTPLERLVDGDRPGPVLAMSDGLVFGHVRTRFRGPRRERFDRCWGVAYQGDRKVVVDSSDGVKVEYDVVLDYLERAGRTDGGRAAEDPLADAAREVARRMRASVPAAPSEDLEDRLRSWGY